MTSSKSIYKNKYTEVLVDTLKLDGHEWEHVYLIKPNKKGVGVIPLDAEGIYLVNQYRHPIRSFLWQLPMGMIDIGMSEEETVRQELLEEAGFKAKHLTRIGSFFAEPGVIDQEQVVYVAEKLKAVEQKPEETEVGMKVKHFTFAEINSMILNGELQCGFTLSSLLLFNKIYLKK